MANDDRTEKPTGKRLPEARKKGQVAKSQDLGGALVLGAGLISLSFLGPAIVNSVAAMMRDILSRAAAPAQVSSAAGLNGIFHSMFGVITSTVGPVAAICVAVGVLANVAQVGLRPRFTGLKPQFKRIDPFSGAKNLFGPRAAFETGKAMAKVGLVGAVVAAALVPQITHLSTSVDTTPGALGKLLGSGVMSICQRASMAYLLIGVVDYI